MSYLDLNYQSNSVNIDPSVKYGSDSVKNAHMQMVKPLINDSHTPAPILSYSPTQDASEKNIEMLEKFVDSNDEYLKSLPPLEFEYRYMPNIGVGKVDKSALLGAAYEEMGAKELSVEDFENRYLIDEDSMTAKPLDINNDGKIHVSEYATNILATDLLSKGTTDVSKIDGTINTKGLNAMMEYSKKSNAEAAVKLYSNLYNTYNLNTLA